MPQILLKLKFVYRTIFSSGFNTPLRLHLGITGSARRKHLPFLAALQKSRPQTVLTFDKQILFDPRVSLAFCFGFIKLLFITK